MFLRPDFRQGRKHVGTSDFFFERPKYEKKSKIEKFLNSRKQSKSAHLGHSKCQNSVVFKDIDMEFCTHIQRKAVFHMYSAFENQKVSWGKIEKYYDYFFPIFKIFESSEI